MSDRSFFVGPAHADKVHALRHPAVTIGRVRLPAKHKIKHRHLRAAIEHNPLHCSIPPNNRLRIFRTIVIEHHLVDAAPYHPGEPIKRARDGTVRRTREAKGDFDAVVIASAVSKGQKLYLYDVHRRESRRGLRLPQRSQRVLPGGTRCKYTYRDAHKGYPFQNFSDTYNHHFVKIVV